jgi:hypothetical protein
MDVLVEIDHGIELGPTETTSTTCANADDAPSIKKAATIASKAFFIAVSLKMPHPLEARPITKSTPLTTVN